MVKYEMIIKKLFYLVEPLLPRFLVHTVIRHTVHKKEALTPKEQEVLSDYITNLGVVFKTQTTSTVIAFVGLIGSGKNTVASYLHTRLGAEIVHSDQIRLRLRKKNLSFKNVRLIAELIMQHVIKNGGIAVMCSDHIDPAKRESLVLKAQEVGTKVHFVRVISEDSNGQPDQMFGNILEGRQGVEEFYAGASSTWIGGRDQKWRVIKLREMWRRTPLHYEFYDKQTGQLELRNLKGVEFSATVNTANGDEEWVEELIKKWKS